MKRFCNWEGREMEGKEGRVGSAGRVKVGSQDILSQADSRISSRYETCMVEGNGPGAGLAEGSRRIVD